ncbi:MAG: hypothetical protein ACRCSK_06185 [Fusobacteriaceae bacterium]
MKRALVLFGNEVDTKNLIQSSIYMKEKFGYSLSGLFLSDIREGIVVTPKIDGLINDSSLSLNAEQWIHFEQDELKRIETTLKNEGLKLEVSHEIGVTGEVIKEYMKSFDLLIIGKGAFTSDLLISLLKHNYKSILMVGNEKIDFSKIYLANDDGLKINRSAYSFTTLFPEFKEFVSVSVENSSKKENVLNEYLKLKKKKIIEQKVQTKDELVNIFENMKEQGILVMGNLSKSYFFEKIERRTGIKLIEKSNITIFIG